MRREKWCSPSWAWHTAWLSSQPPANSWAKSQKLLRTYPKAAERRQSIQGLHCLALFRRRKTYLHNHIILNLIKIFLLYIRRINTLKSHCHSGIFAFLFYFLISSPWSKRERKMETHEWQLSDIWSLCPQKLTLPLRGLSAYTNCQPEQ